MAVFISILTSFFYHMQLFVRELADNEFALDFVYLRCRPIQSRSVSLFHANVNERINMSSKSFIQRDKTLMNVEFGQESGHPGSPNAAVGLYPACHQCHHRLLSCTACNDCCSQQHSTNGTKLWLNFVCTYRLRALLILSWMLHAYLLGKKYSKSSHLLEGATWRMYSDSCGW